MSEVVYGGSCLFVLLCPFVWMINCGLDMLDLVLLVKYLMELVVKFCCSIGSDLFWGLESTR